MPISEYIPHVITGVASVLSGGALVNWLKDRKKDNATALLTNVEALQRQYVALTDMISYLRKENAQLALDRDTADERARKLRARLSEVEEQLEETQRTAKRALQQVAELRTRVREIAAQEDKNRDERS